MRRLLRWLRSPRLATWLFIIVTAYAILATLWPHGGPALAEVREWDAEHPRAARILAATGMHRPYSRPWFLLAAVVLTASTSVCAYDRSRRSAQEYARARGITKLDLAATRTSPDFVIGAGGEDPTEALRLTARRLRAMRWRVAEGPRALVATQNRFGYLGSPLFHWALVALFLAAGLGQLTRSEGILGCITGGKATADSAGSYLEFEAGPLFRGNYTNVAVRVDSFEADYTVDGINRGDVPHVIIEEDGRQVAAGLVYPNHPLRYRSLLIHREEPGPALVTRLSSADDSITQEFLFRKSETATLGIAPYQGALFLDAEYGVRLEPRQGQRIAITLFAADGSIAATEQVVGVGETAALPAGVGFEPVSFTAYSALRVQNDWSVPYIYLSFVLATIGICLAVFSPPRRLVALSIAEDGASLAVRVFARKMDPGIKPRLAREFAEGSETFTLETDPVEDKTGDRKDSAS